MSHTSKLHQIYINQFTLNLLLGSFFWQRSVKLIISYVLKPAHITHDRSLIFFINFYKLSMIYIHIYSEWAYRIFIRNKYRNDVTYVWEIEASPASSWTYHRTGTHLRTWTGTRGINSRSLPACHIALGREREFRPRFTRTERATFSRRGRLFYPRVTAWSRTRGSNGARIEGFEDFARDRESKRRA